MVTKDTILSAPKRKPTPVEIPNWGGTVYIRVMDGSERDAYEAEQYQFRGKSLEVNRTNVRSRLLVRCISDENGNRLFSDDDADALGKSDCSDLDKAYAVALKVNGFTQADIDDLAKNS